MSVSGGAIGCEASRRAGEGADVRERKSGAAAARERKARARKRGRGRDGQLLPLWFPRPFHPTGAEFSDMGLAHTEVDHGT